MYLGAKTLPKLTIQHERLLLTALRPHAADPHAIRMEHSLEHRRRRALGLFVFWVQYGKR